MWRDGKARWPQWLILAVAAGLAALLLRGLFYARTFPLVHDAAIMRYVVFMIDRGHAPYTQMLEMNLPGALMSEWFSVHVFGADAAGLWRWDTFIGLMVATAAISIAGRGFRAAGACGAMLAWLLHLNDGALMFGERDWLIAALLLLGAACATQALRSYQPAWMAAAIAFAGWATTIKPFAVLVPMALLVLALWSFRLRKQRAAVIAWAAAGAAIPMLAVLLYFGHWPGAFRAFLYTERTIGAWYGAIGRMPVSQMLTGVLLYPALALLALTAYLWLRQRVWRQPQNAVLPLCFLCAGLIYLLQHKGFPYHLYPLVVFGFVSAFVTAQKALAATWDQRVAAACILLLGAWRLPVRYFAQQPHQSYPIATQEALTRDLQRLGGRSLSGHIQCLDMTLGGCVGALYGLQLEQTTGYVNDHVLFPYEERPYLSALQQRFLHEVQSDPPAVFVLTDHNWPDEADHTFSKLQRWPQFASFLQDHYRLEITHVATTAARSADYRIYVRKP